MSNGARISEDTFLATTRAGNDVRGRDNRRSPRSLQQFYGRAGSAIESSSQYPSHLRTFGYWYSPSHNDGSELTHLIIGRATRPGLTQLCARRDMILETDDQILSLDHH